MKKPRPSRANATGRNQTEQYIPVSYAMARSPAWRSLSGVSVKVWVELRARYNGANNGKLTLSLDEAARLLGIGKATVKRAYAELQAKGFIVMTRPGQWYGRLATEWAVTDRSFNGHPPTHAWRQWGPAKKQTLGSQADRNTAATVPSRNREAKSWSATEPVGDTLRHAIGSEAERL